MAKKKKPTPNKTGRKQAAPEAATPTSNQPAWLRPVLIHAGIILAFFVLVAIYFKPLVFDGKVPLMSDIVHFKGMSKETVDFREQYGEEPLWTSAMFSGMPAFQNSILFSGDLFNKINQLLWFGIPRPANYVFLYFLGFFFLLRTLRINPWLSGLGAAAFALSTYFFVILEAGHTSKANAIAYMGPLLAGMILTYRGKILLGGVITAFFTALELTTNHYQMTYYLVIAMLVLGIVYGVEAIREGKLVPFAKATGVLLVAGLLGAGPSAGRLLTTLEYGNETMRGKAELSSVAEKQESGLEIDYAYAWSYGIMESFTLLIPDFYGGASATVVEDPDLQRQFRDPQRPRAELRFPTYWGDVAFTSGPVYVGAIICFLFVLGLLVVKGPLRIWLIATTILFLMLSWGRNLMWFNEFMFYYFPGYNKFRAVSTALVIVELTMPLLAILALDKIVKRVAEKGTAQDLLPKVYISAGITGGLCLLFALLGPSLFSFSGLGDGNYQQQPQVLDIFIEYRQNMMTSDAWRSLAFILLGGGLVWLFVQKRIKEVVLYAGLAVLILLDLFPVNKRYLNEGRYVSKSQYERQFAQTPADQFILQDQDLYYRTINMTVNPWTDSETSYYHKNVGGYHAAKLRRYQDMIDRHLTAEQQRFIQAIRQPDSLREAAISGLQVLNMLNTRYFILDEQRQGGVYQNRWALGNAWFVNNIQFVNSPDEEISALRNFNPRETAVVDQVIREGAFAAQLEGFAPGNSAGSTISLTAFKPNHLTYTANVANEGVAIFSEIYYNDDKGWNAYLNGEKVSHFRANYILRGMRLPAGQHTIEFKFEPSSYYTGNTLALIFSLIILLGLAGVVYLEFFRKKAGPSEEG
jgi:hypothetical protein